MCFILILNSQILFSVQWFCKAEIVYWSCISILRQLLLFRFYKGFLLSFFQESQDESALLWLDEIQKGINDSNNNIKEAAICKH